MTDPRTADLIARDLASLWHPFTQHSTWPSDDPTVIERGEGSYIYDTEGRRYLDGTSSLWVLVHGHRDPQIDAAVRAQLDKIAHSTFLGLSHEPGIELAERLLASAPADGGSRLGKVFYAGDGSSAVEAALKMAYQAHAQRGEQRPFFLHVREGYHGDTLGSVSVGGIDLFHHTYRPILLRTLMVDSPGVLAEGQTRADRAAEVLAAMSALLDVRGTEVAAVIIEPMVQAAGGMLVHDASFVSGVRELCNRHGALMIADEVATGVGRTGRMWACEHAGVVPDLMTLGKGVTGGYLPLSAVLATDAVYDAFLGAPAEAKTFFHGHTYTANPLACAAANATLRLIDERGTVARAAAIGRHAEDRLTTELKVTDGVREVRRVGAMIGVEVASAGVRTGFEVCKRARADGVWVRPLDDTVVIMPPLSISDDELDHLLDVTINAIQEVVG